MEVVQGEKNTTKICEIFTKNRLTFLHLQIVNISVTHDMGFKKIEFIINNDVYVYDENFSKYDKNKTEVEFDFPLKEGENKVQVNAYSLEKVSENEGETLENYAFKKFTGKCTYEP